MVIPRVFQIAVNPKEKKNRSSSLERFTTVDSTFSSTPPYQVARPRERESREYSFVCFRTERFDGGLCYLSDLQGLQGERLSNPGVFSRRAV